MKTKIQNRLFAKMFSQKGNIIAISLSATAVMLLSAIGISTIVISSLKSSSDIVRNNNAFLAAESGIENALYEISAHSAGYEVQYNYEEDDHSRIDLKNVADSESWWGIDSRKALEEAMNGSDLFIPAPETSDPADEENWAEASFNTTKVIKLYADNTSCSAEGGKSCGE